MKVNNNMNIQKKNQIKIGIVLTYTSIVIKILIELCYTPIMLRFLGESQYGLYQLAYSTISYLGLLSLGFGSAYIRYYSKYEVKKEYENIAKLNGLFMIIFSIISIISLILGSIIILNIDIFFEKSLSTLEIDTVRILMIFLVINLAITFPNSVFQSYIIAKEQFFFQRIINIFTIILNPFLCLPLLLLGYKSIALVIVSTFLTIISTVINIWFCLDKIKMKFRFKNLEFELLKEIACFSSFIFINQIVDQINWNVDKFILGIYSGTSAIAIYSLGATINNMYLQFSTAISSVFIPRVNRITFDSDESDKELTKLFTKIGGLQFIILSFILIAYIFIGKQFMVIWAGKKYIESYYVTLFLIVPVTIPLIQNLGIEIQRAKNMHYFRSYAYIIVAIINIIISIPLCKLYGAIGSAIGTAISLIIGNIFIMNWYYHYKMGINIKYFFAKIIPISRGLILPIIFGFFTVKYIEISTLLGIVIWGIIYSFIYCLAIWLFVVDSNDKKRIIKIVCRFKKERIYDCNK